jgi:hypothetical protein
MSDSAEIERLREEHRLIVQQRFEQLPLSTLPVRDNTVVLMPSHDYRVDIETHKGLLSSFSMYAGEMTMCGHSDIGIARNKLFNSVLRTPYEWIACIDTDIGFTSDDLRVLLEWKGPRDYAVQGAYSKKQDINETVTQGLGFTRLHRCVLEAIRLHMPFIYKDDGNDFQDFCITGVNEKGGLLREDSGFWFLCSEIGVKPRIIAPALRHYGGRRAYEVSELQKRLIHEKPT